MPSSFTPPNPYGLTGSISVSDATGRSIAYAAIAAPPVDQPTRCGVSTAERVHQRRGVVGPVAQAARGVDRHVLGVPEPAHVRGDQPVAVRRALEQVLIEAAGGQVAVDQDDRNPVLGPGFDDVHPQAIGVDAV